MGSILRGTGDCWATAAQPQQPRAVALEVAESYSWFNRTFFELRIIKDLVPRKKKIKGKSHWIYRIYRIYGFWTHCLICWFAYNGLKMERMIFFKSGKIPLQDALTVNMALLMCAGYSVSIRTALMFQGSAAPSGYVFPPQ